MSDDTDKHERIDAAETNAIEALRATITPGVITWLTISAKQARKAKDPGADGFDALLALAIVLAESGK